jgi:FkbM family methyltransferase
MTYHSEYLQDRWLEENVFKGKIGGTFIESGALNGILHSNTLFFERERAWKGILVEPNPDCFPSLHRNRPMSKVVQAALWSRPTTLLFEKISGGLYGWSAVSVAIDETQRQRMTANIPKTSIHFVRVQAVTLNDVLCSLPSNKVDYLSLDVEGSELAVLSVLDWEGFDIDVIGVEDNFGDPELAELIRSHGYEHLARVGVDEIWRKIVK